jgi:hypothetical protein
MDPRRPTCLDPWKVGPHASTETRNPRPRRCTAPELLLTHGRSAARARMGRPSCTATTAHPDSRAVISRLLPLPVPARDVARSTCGHEFHYAVRRWVPDPYGSGVPVLSRSVADRERAARFNGGCPLARGASGLTLPPRDSPSGEGVSAAAKPARTRAVLWRRSPT